MHKLVFTHEMGMILDFYLFLCENDTFVHVFHDKQIKYKELKIILEKDITW